MNSLKQIACIAVVALALYGGYSLLVPREVDNTVSNEFRKEMEAEGIFLPEGGGENGTSALHGVLGGAPSLSAPKHSGNTMVPSVLSNRSEFAPKYGANYDLDDAPPFDSAPAWDGDDAPSWDSDAVPTDEAPAWDSKSSHTIDDPLFDIRLPEIETGNDEQNNAANDLPIDLPNQPDLVEPELFNLDLTPIPIPQKAIDSSGMEIVQNQPPNARSTPLPENGTKPKPLNTAFPVLDDESQITPLPTTTSNDVDIQTRLSNQAGNRVSADMFDANHTSTQPGNIPTPLNTQTNTSYNQRAPVSVSANDLVQRLPEVEEVPQMTLAGGSTSFEDNQTAPLENTNLSGNNVVSGYALSSSSLSDPSHSDQISSESFELPDDSAMGSGYLGEIPNFDALPNLDPDPIADTVVPEMKPSSPPSSAPGVARSSQPAARNASSAPLPTDPPFSDSLREKSDLELFDRLNSTQSIDPLGKLDVPPIGEADLISIDRSTNVSQQQPSSPKPEVTKNTIRGEISKKIEHIRQVLNDENVDFRVGHRMATELYQSELYPAEREMLLSFVGECGWTAFFSRTWTPLESALYVVQPNDTIQSVADKRHVSTELIMKINGLQAPVFPPPGTQMKIPQGPFHAIVSLSNRELILLSEGLFACRFKLGIGKKEEIPTSVYEIVEKFENPTYTGNGNEEIEANDPRNPLGTHWIELSGAIGFHGTNDPDCIGTDNAPVEGFSLNNKEIAELYDLLTSESKITIRQ